MHRPPLPLGNIPGILFCQRLSQPQRHSAAVRIMSIKNSNDAIGNRTRNVQACSAISQPTAPPCVYSVLGYKTLVFLRYFETYLGLCLQSNINISFIHNCAFICTLSELFNGHKNLEKSSLMLLYKGHTDRLVCVLAAREMCGQKPSQENKIKKSNTVSLMSGGQEKKTISY